MKTNYLKWLSFSCAIWLVVCGCSRMESEHKDVPKVPESFQFMDIGANTVIDSGVRDRLREALGPGAVDPHSTIDLELKYKGFLKTYYPDLARVNQRLNINDVVRKEYPATRLTFRNARQRDSVFDYVEVIYDDESGCPLLIKTIAKREIPGLIRPLEDKYGEPDKISISQGKSWSLSWRKNGDVFVIARIMGRYDLPEHHMMILYLNRLEQMLSRLTGDETREERPAGDAFL